MVLRGSRECSARTVWDSSMGRKWGGKFAQFLLVSTWLSAAACVAPSGAAAFSVKDAAVGVWGTFSEWYDPGCPFVDDPGAALRQVLGERMAGQDAALKEVVDAVTEWHNASMEAGGAGGAPLVMAFSGTTGVGKTETAQTVADAVLDPSVEQEGDRPKGLLELDGNSYKDPQQVAVYQEAIKRRLGEHLLKCRSRAVVVLDEAQNCVPEVLDALKTSIQADRPHLETVVGGKLTRFDTSNLIFIIISDIGVGDMLKLIVNEKGEDVSMTAIGDEVRRRLDARFQSLEIGAYVQNVVPFLPLTADGVARVVELRLRHLSREWRQTGRWRGLSWSDTVLRVLAAKPYIQYVYASTDKLAARFAKYGAREVHTKADGPLKLLKRRLRESVIGNIHNSTSTDVRLSIEGTVGSLEMVMSLCTEEPTSAGAKPCELDPMDGTATGACRERQVCSVGWRGSLATHTAKGVQGRRVTQPAAAPAAETGDSEL